MEPPDVGAILAGLAASDVRYVLTGSLAAAAHGAPLSARHVDVTPALDIDNLHRVARFLRKSHAKPHFSVKDELARQQCERWEPYPVALANLDHLFETVHGLVGIVPELAGAYRDLHRRAVPMEAFGVTVQVAHLDDVLAAVRSSPHAAYPELERRGLGRPASGDGTPFRPVTRIPPPALEAGALAAASRALSDRVGRDVRLRIREAVVSETGYRNVLVRCDVEGSLGGDLPRTLLLKRSNLETGELWREWAGFELLARHPAASPHLPRFFGGDREHRLVLLEDLGDVRDRDLAGCLVASEPAAATEFLIGYAAAAGGLQAATFGAAAEHASIVASLPAAEPRPHASDRLPESLRNLSRRFHAAGVALGEPARAQIEAAARALESPGPLCGFSRGDVCTKNVVRVDGAVKIFDLEYGGYRHALVDGAFFGLRHLHCLYAGRFPDDLTRQAQDAYRTALARGCPAACDDTEWARGFAAASLGWLAAILDSLPNALEDDRRRGSATIRQRILAALEEFGTIADRSKQLPAVAEAGTRLGERLASRWEVAPLPVYPAFRPAG